jgi:hypothetical protein
LLHRAGELSGGVRSLERSAKLRHACGSVAVLLRKRAEGAVYGARASRSCKR